MPAVTVDDVLALPRVVRPDLAVDTLRDSGLLTAFVCRSSAARFCAGFECAGRAAFLDRAAAPAGPMHFTAEMAELADSLGLPPPVSPALSVPMLLQNECSSHGVRHSMPTTSVFSRRLR